MTEEEVKTKMEEDAKKFQDTMESAANELAEAVNMKVLVLFYDDETNQAGGFRSTNLSPLEERGLIALASR